MKNHHNIIKGFADKKSTNRPIFRKRCIESDGAVVTSTVTNSYIMLRESYPTEDPTKYRLCTDIYSGAIVDGEKYPNVNRVIDGVYSEVLETSPLLYGELQEIVDQLKVNKKFLVHLEGDKISFKNGVSYTLFANSELTTDIWASAEWLMVALKAVVASESYDFEFNWASKVKPFVFKNSRTEVLVTPVRFDGFGDKMPKGWK